MIETITAREQEPTDPSVVRLYVALMSALSNDKDTHYIEHIHRDDHNDVVMRVNDTSVWIENNQYGINWVDPSIYSNRQFTDLEGVMMRLHHQPGTTLTIVHKSQGPFGAVSVTDDNPMIERLLHKKSIDSIPRYTPMDMVAPEFRGIDGPYVLMEQARHNFRRAVPTDEQFADLDEAVDFIDKNDDPYLQLCTLPVAFDALAGHNILASPRMKPVDVLVPRAQRGTI